MIDNVIGIKGKLINPGNMTLSFSAGFCIKRKRLKGVSPYGLYKLAKQLYLKTPKPKPRKKFVNEQTSFGHRQRLPMLPSVARRCGCFQWFGGCIYCRARKKSSISGEIQNKSSNLMTGSLVTRVDLQTTQWTQLERN